MPNPKKKTPLELDSLARSYTLEAIKQISGILINDPDTGRRLVAAGMLLDRGYGKPKQSTEAKVEGELKFVIRKMLGDGTD